MTEVWNQSVMMKIYDANSRTMMEVGGWRSQLYNEGMWSN